MPETMRHKKNSRPRNTNIDCETRIRDTNIDTKLDCVPETMRYQHRLCSRNYETRISEETVFGVWVQETMNSLLLVCDFFLSF